jgi:hypothetical protein
MAAGVPIFQYFKQDDILAMTIFHFAPSTVCLVGHEWVAQTPSSYMGKLAICKWASNLVHLMILYLPSQEPRWRWHSNDNPQNCPKVDSTLAWLTDSQSWAKKQGVNVNVELHLGDTIQPLSHPFISSGSILAMTKECEFQ